MAAPSRGGGTGGSVREETRAAIARAVGASAGGGTGAAAVSSMEAYNVERVGEFVQQRQWGELELYLRGFITRSGGDPHLHPTLLFYCRRGRVIGRLDAGLQWQAENVYNFVIKPLRDMVSRYTNELQLQSDVDDMWEKLTTSPRELRQPEDIVDKINDYMRFYFKDAIRHPSQGEKELWVFALRTGRRRDRHAIFRCLLCQKVFGHGTFEQTLRTHLQGKCAGMTPYAQEVLEAIAPSKATAGVATNGESSAPKKRSSVHATQQHTPSPSSSTRSPSSAQSEINMQATIGQALLLNISCSAAAWHVDSLMGHLDVIDKNCTNVNLIKKEVSCGIETLLDMLLSTEVTKDECKEIKNCFNSIQFHSTTLTPLQQPAAVAGQLPGPIQQHQPAPPPISADDNEVLNVLAVPSPYDDIWDILDEATDLPTLLPGGASMPTQQAQEPPEL